MANSSDRQLTFFPIASNQRFDLSGLFVLPARGPGRVLHHTVMTTTTIE